MKKPFKIFINENSNGYVDIHDADGLGISSLYHGFAVSVPRAQAIIKGLNALPDDFFTTKFPSEVKPS